jgi:ribonuclease P protein component
VAAARSSPLAAPRAVIVSPSKGAEGAGACEAASTADAPECPAADVVDTAGFGFGSSLRLHKTDEYSSVFAFGACCAGAGSPALLPEQPRHARIGLVVAKKLAKRAVQRNLVKRIGRDCSAMRRPKPAHDLVLRLSAKLDNVTRRMMREDMNSLLGRLPKK